MHLAALLAKATIGVKTNTLTAVTDGCSGSGARSDYDQAVPYSLTCQKYIDIKD
jgi:hypothetical protein